MLAQIELLNNAKRNEGLKRSSKYWSFCSKESEWASQASLIMDDDYEKRFTKYFGGTTALLCSYSISDSYTEKLPYIIAGLVIPDLRL